MDVVIGGPKHPAQCFRQRFLTEHFSSVLEELHLRDGLRPEKEANLAEWQRTFFEPFAQIPDHPPMPLRMHPGGRSVTVVTERMPSQVRLDLDQGPFGMNVLGNHFDSCKRKTGRYTKSGHPATPFAAQALLGKELDAREAA